MQHTIESAYQKVFGSAPELTVAAPGRINLIGEHTDYNSGLVLPAAIDRYIWLSIGRSALANDLHFYAADMGQSFRGSRLDMNPSSSHPWANYLLGVLAELEKVLPHSDQGLQIAFGGNIPAGGGMSSSAALENAVGWAVQALLGGELNRQDMAALSKRAENGPFVGVQCGLMDMFASMMGKKNHVIRLDCQTLMHQYFPLDTTDYRIVLCDTGVRHRLVDSDFNTRQSECQAVLTKLQTEYPHIRSLRDVKPEYLAAHGHILDATLLKRCRYVLEENARVESACRALEANDYEKLGELMYASHAGLRDEYEVSCAELDFLVKEAQKRPYQCLGSRLMGAGFGGGTINLVHADEAASFVSDLAAAYHHAFGREMGSHVVRLVDGTRVL